MRKNSKQIREEILLDQELDKFKHKEKLKQCIDDMLNFKINELDALTEMQELVKDNKILNLYVASIIIEHARNIMNVLGVTIEGFKTNIEELERMKENYAKTRDFSKSRVDKKLN